MVEKIKVKRSFTTGQVPIATGAGDVGEIAVNVTDRKIFVRDTAGIASLISQRIALHSTGLKYAVGDIVIEADVLYYCTTAVAVPGPFVPANWAAVGSSGGSLDGAVILAPLTTGRNRVTTVGQPAASGLVIEGDPAQTADLLAVEGTALSDTGRWAIDSLGFPNARAGAVIWRQGEASHPFTARGQAASFNGLNWVPADAANPDLRVMALVQEIIDANTLVLRSAGRVTALQAGAFAGGIITPGALYYVSDTVPGQLTPTAPAGSRKDAALRALTSTTGIVVAGTSDAASGAAGLLTIASGGGTVTLTADSPETILVTGASTQVITLPAVSTLTLGKTFRFLNQSSGALTLNSSGGSAVSPQTITTGMEAVATCVALTGTTASSWIYRFTGAGSRRGTGDALFASAPTIASPVFTGLPLFPAGAAGSPSMRLPQGVAPTVPVDGDVWTTAAGVFARINGVTVNLTDLGPAPPAFATTPEARAGVRADVVMSPALVRALSGEIEAVASSATVLNMTGIPEEATELDVHLFFGQVGTTAYSVSLRLLNIALAYTSQQIVTTTAGAVSNVENPETGFIFNSTANLSMTGFVSLKRFGTRWYADGRMRMGNGNAARSSISLHGWSDNVLTPMTSVRWLGSGNFTNGSARCNWRI